MEILLVAPYFPYPADHGGKIRVFNIIKYLSQSYPVSLLCFAPFKNEEQCISALSPYCREIRTVVYNPKPQSRFRNIFFSALPPYIKRFYVQEMEDTLTKMTKSGKYSVVLLKSLYMAQYSTAFSPVKRVLVEHNVESQVFHDMRKNSSTKKGNLAAWWDYVKLKVFERRCCRDADMVIAVSEKDKQALAVLCPEASMSVVSNGVDTCKLQLLPHQPASKKIIFTGSLFYYPNLQGVHFFCEQIWPLVRRKIPDAQFLIVGKEPSEQDKLKSWPGVTFTGYVKDVIAYYRESALSIVPLQIGGGTRLKILESMALGRPVISTSKGCEGLCVRHGKDIFIEDDPEGFAKRVTQLLEDQESGKPIVANARQLVEERYSWKNIVKGYDQIFANLFQGTIL